MSTHANINPFAPQRVEGLLLGSYGNCLIKVWTGRALEPQIKALNAYAEQLCELWPEGATCVVVVQEGCPMPRADERRDLSAFYKKVAPRMRAIAQVAEGTTLWASMARSVFTALQLMERRPYPSEVFALPSEGIKWLSTHVKVRNSSPAPDELARNMTEYVASIRAA